MTTDFLQLTRSHVERIADSYGVTGDDAFPIYAATILFALDEDVAFQAARPGGGNDKGIDLVHVDEDSERVIVLQGKYSPHGTVNTNQGHFLKLLNGVDWLEQPEQVEIEGNPQLLESSEQFVTAVKNDYRVEIYFVALGEQNADIQRDADVANGKYIRSKQNRYVTCLFRQQFEEHLRALELQRERVPHCSFTVDNSRFFQQSGAYGEAAVFTLKGSELQRLHRLHGDLLFARNVRLYLGARPGGVNAGLKETLEDESTRRHFFAFNNGVTFVADNFSREGTEITLKNASIVNGCQTTVSLTRHLPDNAGDVEVLVRVIQPPESMIDDVIRYTNSQNQVKIWEIRSQDVVQRKLEKDLDSFDPPYLYSTRRGAKTALSNTEKKRYAVDDDARSLREIKHDELGQAIAAIMAMPKDALKAKSQVFDSLYDKIFPKDITPEYVVFVWMAYGAAATAYRAKVREQDVESLDMTILRTAGKWYVLAVLGRLLDLRHGEWRNQVPRESASSNRTRSRLKQYSEVALTLFLQAMKELMNNDSSLRISVAVRRDDFFPLVAEEVKKLFDGYSLMPEWADKALPRLFNVGKASSTRRGMRSS